MAKQMFVNLAVKDLNKSIDFFTKLGFRFNPQFTDENATCMIINDSAFAMLLTEQFMKRFTEKEMVEPKASTEVINAFSVDSREQVDWMIDKVVAAGGRESRPSEDHGWMYGRSFEDLDGHLWEVIYMDMAKLQSK
ncbi:MAG: VOC family protein [Candidatus Doudnabacteria bacterium]|nr:VOC family protein [Candidatus Doudnabacteria bacterium]